MAQPNYEDSEQDRIQKEVYDLLYKDPALYLTDGVMNYIARLISEYICKRKRRRT